MMAARRIDTQKCLAALALAAATACAASPLHAGEPAQVAPGAATLPPFAAPAAATAASRAARDLSGLSPVRDQFGRLLPVGRQESRIARALGDAWKKDASEANLKAWSEILVKCQQATNPAWSTALMRSEPQQAHCYRY